MGFWKRFGYPKYGHDVELCLEGLVRLVWVSRWPLHRRYIGGTLAYGFKPGDKDGEVQAFQAASAAHEAVQLLRAGMVNEAEATDYLKTTGPTPKEEPDD